MEINALLKGALTMVTVGRESATRSFSPPRFFPSKMIQQASEHKPGPLTCNSHSLDVLSMFKIYHDSADVSRGKILISGQCLELIGFSPLSSVTGLASKPITLRFSGGRGQGLVIHDNSHQSCYFEHHTGLQLTIKRVTVF